MPLVNSNVSSWHSTVPGEDGISPDTDLVGPNCNDIMNNRTLTTKYL